MSIPKLQTGIVAFDLISEGGLPMGRTTLLAGSSGSAKTLFAAQFLAMGILKFNQNGVFVTFEEQVEDIRNDLKGFGWDIDLWESEGKWTFIDASPKEEDVITIGEFDLSAFRIRLERAIAKNNAQRVVIDSIGSIFTHFPEHNIIRQEMSKVTMTLRRVKATALITTERTEEYGAISRYGVEEFLADNVMILRNVLTNERRRRTIEILKFRGSNHVKGESPFTIVPMQAVVIVPISAMKLTQQASGQRVSSGVRELDQMCGGGFFKGSIVLVSGATGAGKTLLASNFINGAKESQERCLLLAFEESREQIFRNAKGWGQDLGQLEADGLLKVVSTYPEVCSLEDHLINIQELVKEFKPDRIALDSISALTRNPSEKGFQEFVVALTNFLKHDGVTTMLTATTHMLTGGASITEGDIATITDTIILLRYVELTGEMQRSITVLKMRGSRHDASIRQILIDEEGMQIGRPITGISGLLSNTPIVA
ncbi:circadian clock protein KaiC [Rufibacter quisquiliarum]|uniref:non-specific serine/threonine protein kinase n=1 Tax=Rufibacter quisquiliarum TaxID=1549639 RepID=A0A839GRT4_9BACT|nr:circadian clock protein KaiC [Rufibacter quisquiliarum]MBA9077128.1 circadian clock protein KaiC [Rufibacter quisquiliarum]